MLWHVSFMSVARAEELHSPGLAIQVHDLLPRLSVSQVRLRADESE